MGVPKEAIKIKRSYKGIQSNPNSVFIGDTTGLTLLLLFLIATKENHARSQYSQKASVNKCFQQKSGLIHCDLGLPASRTMRNLSLSHPICYFQSKQAHIFTPIKFLRQRENTGETVLIYGKAHR
jgi:hypothetical protein